MSKKQSLTLGEAWAEAVGSIGGKAEILGNQLTAAEKQFPELVTSFRVLLGYAGYRENQRALAEAMGKFRGVVSYIPDPLGPAPLPDIIQPWCKNPDPISQEICKCFNDPSACPDPSEEDRPFESVSPCPELCESYRAALECALEFCDGKQDAIKRLTREQYAEWARCQRDIENYWRQLHEQGCFNRLQPIKVLLRMAEAQFG